SGMRINLYNNKWGTNFPMWWEGTVLFRIVVTMASPQDSGSDQPDT
ncbi:MAG: hypothetical protein JWP99_385, partial [Devosia sp.]|nr:hypothetical protein [Devosia sp.]